MLNRSRICSIEGCQRPHVGYSFCGKHLKKWNRYGDPLAGHTKRPNGTLLAWLRAAVRIETDECQLWPFSRNNNGYGFLHFNGKRRFAHHVALLLVNRTVPVKPLESRHTFGHGNLGCINPRHLIDGTHKQNIEDAIWHGTFPRGERNGVAKLTEAQVLAIRAAPRAPWKLRREIAKKLGVNTKAIRDVQLGKTWRHLL